MSKNLMMYLLILLIFGYCSAQKMPVFYYHHQIPIKIIHGYELKPIYSDNHSPAASYHGEKHAQPQHVPMNHRPHYHAMVTRPVGIHMPPPTPGASLHHFNKRPHNINFAGTRRPGPPPPPPTQRFHPSQPDSGFQPIVKPSPPTFMEHHNIESDLHNYGYVRNYVDLLKQRQKEHFNTNPEINYFKQREHEIGHPIQKFTHVNAVTPSNVYKVTDDTIDDQTNDHKGYQASSGENHDLSDHNAFQSAEEHSYGNENKEDALSEEEEYKENAHKFHDEHDEQDVSHEGKEETDEPYKTNFADDPYAEDESRQHETLAHVTPIRTYSQVRHTENKYRLPKPTDEPRVREKLSTGKTHIVYKEEGYEDTNYDHLDAEKNAELELMKKKKKRSNVKNVTVSGENHRNKRDLDGHNDYENMFTILNQNPFVLSDFPANSTVRSVYKTLTIPRPRYINDQFASLSENIQTVGIAEAKLNQYTKDKNNNKKYKSIYRSKPAIRCAPDEIPNLTDDSFNGKVKKRGGQLGEKLDCLKVKYFGKDPFKEPFFKENLNVSEVVYDDIMRHINGKKSNLKKRKASPGPSVAPAPTALVEITNNTNIRSQRTPLVIRPDDTFSPLIFPTTTTEQYEMPDLLSIPLKKDNKKLHSSIFDINIYYPNRQQQQQQQQTQHQQYTTFQPTISFTTLRPVVEPLAQQSRPYRSYSRAPQRWSKNSHNININKKKTKNRNRYTQVPLY